MPMIAILQRAQQQHRGDQHRDFHRRLDFEEELRQQRDRYELMSRTDDLTSLSKLLDGWDPARRILWADESRVGPADALSGLPRGPWAVLIGPEGGFSPPERKRLRDATFVTPISLGPRILRADTAAVALLTLFQAHLGDW